MGAFAAAGAWPGILRRVSDGEALSFDEARAAMQRVLTGEATPVQIAGFLIAIRARGNRADEVAGMVEAMLDAASPLELPDPAATIDIVGTGGSAALRGSAFNVSTMSSVVAAAAGATVCKHGNRKASSSSGSTDLLEALGVEIDLDGPGVVACVQQAGVGFAFARMFHPAMRHAAPVRAELGVPTVFNLLGPLSHPGRVGRQVIGVPEPEQVELIAAALQRRGVVHAWVVHGHDGLDELTTTTSSTVIEVLGTQMRTFEIHPGELGLARATLGQLAVGDHEANARAATQVLDGELGPLRDMVLLNTAAALVVAGVSPDMAQGIERGASAIDEGLAARTMAELVAASRAVVHGRTDEGT